MKNIAILASSNASDFPAVFDACKDWILKWKAQIKCAIVNKDGIWAIDKFMWAWITCYLTPTKWEDRLEVYEKIDWILWHEEIDLVVCIWWMNIMPSEFVKEWEGRIINVHPAYLPSFPWWHALEDALKAWVKETWATVHYIDEWVDTWEIILQKKVQIEKGETIESLKTKVQKIEQEIYPEAIVKVVDWLDRWSS